MVAVRVGNQFSQFGEVEVAEFRGFVLVHLAVGRDLEHQAGVRDLDLPDEGESGGCASGKVSDLGLLAVVEDLRDGDRLLVTAEQHRIPVSVCVLPEQLVDREVAFLQLCGGQDRPPFFSSDTDPQIIPRKALVIKIK